MNYKEKYEQALKMAQETYNTQPMYMEWLEKMFPELKESKDERIREALIRFHKSTIDIDGIKGADIISWLEKQGNREIYYSQNHQDSDHPNGCIVLEDFNGGEGFYKLNLDYLNKKQVEEVEEMVRTWNKESKTSNENIKSCIGMCLTDANEQRFNDYNTTLKDCLDWLKKQGEQKPADVRTTGYWHVEDVEQNHAWSEEEEHYIRQLESMVKDRWALAEKAQDEEVIKNMSNLAFFLKTLKKPSGEDMKALLRTEYEKGRADAIAEMQKEWSEEDEETLGWLCTFIKEYGHEFYEGNEDNVVDWLKSLKGRVQPKQEWSEEDSVKLQRIIDFLWYNRKGDTDAIYQQEQDIDWLKSLRPQNRWEPSDGQMKALNYVVNLMASSESPKENDYYYNVFKDLRKQLKKLKEGKV